MRSVTPAHQLSLFEECNEEIVMQASCFMSYPADTQDQHETFRSSTEQGHDALQSVWFKRDFSAEPPWTWSSRRMYDVSHTYILHLPK